MSRFDIPGGWTMQAYRFALDPTPRQQRVLRSHCGASRFAFNHMLAGHHTRWSGSMSGSKRTRFW
ncbi:helix-turn-helix domain-containing protein [Nocardia salmonicida]|uniref:helix-turn-helix domain-containing protein n=1 Tax=Nocardia salmonicida TaxID=53431 RepID=UPI00386D89B9